MTGETDRGAVEEFYSRWFGAMEAGEIDGFLALLSDDFLLKSPGRPAVTDRGELRRGLEQFHAEFTESVDYVVQEVEVAGEWAWVQVRERVRLRPRDGSDEVELRGLHLAVLRRGGEGGWLLHRDVSSFDHPV